MSYSTFIFFITCFTLILIFSAPSVVQNLHAKETQPREVVLTWNAPRVTNGIITAYIVEYRGRRNDMVNCFIIADNRKKLHTFISDVLPKIKLSFL